ncbi:MAG: hypothetical protein AMXMBFR66_23870 [Pseudomonadota bacterium]|nr:hypothetical protein [Rubrivivax sp.]
MRLLIPFAAPPATARAPADWTQARGAAGPALPRLAALLAQRVEAARDPGDACSLTPPHERALARALGWTGGDGRLPFAARAARADGLDSGEVAVALATPVHLELEMQQVRLADPARLELSEQDSRALFEAARALVTSAGFGFAFGAASRWYLLHESLAELATASLDRAIGRSVTTWQRPEPEAGRIRRLQSEVQMLLHVHPVNAAREARGLAPVNSVWLSGCGVAQHERGPAPAIDWRLRAPALAGDAVAWGQAWQALDAGPIAALAAAAARGEAVELILCGERSGVTLRVRRRPAWQRLALRLAAPPAPWALLESL